MIHLVNSNVATAAAHKTTVALPQVQCTHNDRGISIPQPRVYVKRDRTGVPILTIPATV